MRSLKSNVTARSDKKMTHVQFLEEKIAAASTGNWMTVTAVLRIRAAVVKSKISVILKSTIIIDVTTATLNTTLQCSNMLLRSALVEQCNLIRKTRRN